MIIFNTDIDNTMIYSYKHDIGQDKVCAEVYQGREISFMTGNTVKLLKAVSEKVLIVPTTTRTTEQYERIDLGTGTIKYALTCNGGILLIDGKESPDWYRQSLKLISAAKTELKKSQKILEKDINRSFEVRNIRELFIFTKSSEPQKTVEMLKESTDENLVDIFCNGVKVYAVPKTLNKGAAVKRFRKFIGADKVIAAGDSEFDISMLNAADTAIAPERLSKFSALTDKAILVSDDRTFSEEILKYIINLTATP